MLLKSDRLATEMDSLVSDRQSLVDMMLAIKEKQVLDPLVDEILITWIEMLDKYREGVINLDMEALHAFFEDRMESLSRRCGEQTGPVTIERDITHVYNHASLTLVKGAYNLLYPHGLAVIPNYREGVKQFCRLFEASDLSASALVDCLLEVSIKGKVMLDSQNVTLMKEILELLAEPGKSFARVIGRYEKKPLYARARYLNLIGVEMAVNFPSLGLIPYLHLEKPGENNKFPAELEPFIETEFRTSVITRLLMLPRKRKRELLSLLPAGKTGRLDEYYITHNLSCLKREANSHWNWSLGGYRDSSATYRYRLIDETAEIKHLTKIRTGYPAFMDHVHRYGNTGLEELAYQAGIKLRTVQDYAQKAIEQGILLYYLSLDHVNLDHYHELFLETSRDSKKVVDNLTSFPCTKIMETEKFTRVLMYLPPGGIEIASDYLVGEEKKGSCRVLARGDFTFQSKKKDSSFDLRSYLEVLTVNKNGKKQKKKQKS